MTIKMKSQQNVIHPPLKNTVDLSQLSRTVFKVLFYAKDIHGKRPTHGYIASRTNLSISTVQRALKTLRSHDLVNWDSEYHCPNTYYLASYLRTKPGRAKLYSLYKYFFALSFVLLLSPLLATTRNDRLKLNKCLNTNVYRERVSIYTSPDYPLLVREHPKFLEHGVTATIKTRTRNKMTLKLRLEALANLQKIFPLTTHGIINVKKYPAQAITYATRFVPQCITKLDPFAYFLAICERYCKENRLDIDRHRYEQERFALGILDTDSTFLNTTRLEEMLREQQESEARGQTYLASKSSKNCLKREERKSLSLYGARARYIPEELPSEEDIIQTRREVVAKLAELNGDANPFAQMLADKWRVNM